MIDFPDSFVMTSTTSNLARVDEKSSSKEAELVRLQAENAALTQLVAKLRLQHAGNIKPLSKDTSAHAENFYSQLQKSIHERVQTQEKRRQSTSGQPGEEEKLCDPESNIDDGEPIFQPTRKSPFFASGVPEHAKSAIFVCKSGALDRPEDEDEFADSEEGDDRAYVCVMDVPDDQWWEIVEPVNEDVEPVIVEDPFDSDSSYEIIGNTELIESLSEFVTSTIKHHPETFALSDLQLKKMLDGTFVTLQKKGTLGKIVEYGTLAYSAYGWGSYAWQLYSKPGVATFVVKGIYTTGSWMIWLCL